MARPRRAEPFRLWRHPKHGTWYVLYPEAGSTGRKSTGTKDRREAEAWRQRFLAGIEAPAAPEAVTISAICDGYLAERKGEVRSWQTLHYSCLPLKQHLGDLRPGDLASGVMKKYAKARRLQGRQNGTIIREIVTLRAALKWARREKWISAAPDLPMPVSAPPPRDRWLTKAEARKLVRSATAQHVQLYILLALYTAARRGAILELRWPQVDLTHHRIEYGAGHGNKRRSVVPIGGELLKALKEAKEIACTDYVMEFNGTRIRSVRTGFERACQRAKLRAVTPHTLRHTAATWAVMDGVPLAEVARLLGDSEKMVEKVYGKHSPDYLRRAVKSLRF